jgi:VIT1/CCC1 family predicted Fe2+/Mn2+ transporter
MSGLDRWLEQATRHLSQESAAQVRAEIREHFESAREAAISDGAAEDEADRRALTALGDPKAANRQYRKVRLTSAEARVLSEESWDAQFLYSRRFRRPLTLAAFVLGAAAVVLLISGASGVGRACALAAFAFAFLFGVTSLPIYTPSRSRFVRYMSLVVVAAMPILALGSDALPFFWLVISCLGPVFWIESTRHSIRRKLPVARWPRHLYL